MRKNLVITLSVMLLGFILFPLQSFAYVWANESCSTFYPTGCSTGAGGNIQGMGVSYKLDTGQTLGQLIAEGAGNFASSQSQYLEFLNKIEMSDLSTIDYQGMRVNLLSAIDCIEKAIATYANIILIADATPYNSDIIKRLETFDYVTFQNKNNLNGIVFGLASDYLKRGDVRGIYAKLHSDLLIISGQLMTVKSMIDKELFPELVNVWRVNQMYAELMLFGQQVTEVFYEIKR